MTDQAELADLRRDVIELREWKASVLSKCKHSDGFDALEWGGDKEGWGFVHYFIGHLETRALHAETVLAEQGINGVAQRQISPSSDGSACGGSSQASQHLSGDLQPGPSEPAVYRILCTNNGATGYLYTEVLPFEPGPGVHVRRDPEPLYSDPAYASLPPSTDVEYVASRGQSKVTYWVSREEGSRIHAVAMARNLSTAARGLLEWLSKDDGQYGECYGESLDALIRQGFAKVGGEETGTSNGFIAKGSDIMYRSVSITETGRLALSSTNQSAPVFFAPPSEERLPSGNAAGAGADTSMPSTKLQSGGQ